MVQVPVSEQIFPEGNLYTWLSMQALPDEEPDVGDAVAVAQFTDRVAQHSGLYINASKLAWDFTNDEILMPWFTGAGIGTYYAITPGARGAYSTFLNTRFVRPRALVGMPGPIDVTLFCVHRIVTV